MATILIAFRIMHDRKDQRVRTVFSLAIRGAVAGLAAGWAMDTFARVARAVRGGREARGAAPGVERDGRGAQPPQAMGSTDQDAAVRVGSAAYELLIGRRPPRHTRLRLGTAAHYAFSAGTGAFYIVSARYLPLVRAGNGTVYGSLVWLLADEGAMPALGLSRGPAELPWPVHAYALSAHWVYGAALDAAARLLDRADVRR
jgi:putative membrane protein